MEKKETITQHAAASQSLYEAVRDARAANARVEIGQLRQLVQFWREEVCVGKPSVSDLPSVLDSLSVQLDIDGIREHRLGVPAALRVYGTFAEQGSEEQTKSCARSHRNVGYSSVAVFLMLSLNDFESS